MHNIGSKKYLKPIRFGIVTSKSFFRFSIILIVAIIVTTFIFTDNCCPDYYKLLPILPLGHVLAIFFSMFFNKKLFEKWQSVLVIGIYSIRNLFTPLLMYLGNYTGSFKQLTSKNVTFAIVLMLYETLVVFIFIAIYSCNSNEELKSNRTINKSTSHNFNNILCLLTLFCVFIYIFFPNVRNMYTNLFSSEGIRIQLVKSSDIQGSIGQRGIFTLFSVVFPITYLFLSVKFLCFVNEGLFTNKIIKNLLYLSISLIPAFFMDGGDGNTIIFITAIFITALFIDNSRNKNMIKFALIIACTIIIYVFFEAMSSALIYKKISFFENLSIMFQAYFPGVCNMAGLFNMNSYNKISQLFYDLYSTIPFRNTLFGLSGFETTLNLFTYDNNAESHIMPCIAHSFYYVGILAPVVPCFILKKSFDVYIKMINTSDPYKYISYSLIFIYLILTPIMYNSLIFLRHYFATFLPMVLLCRLNTKQSI